MPVCNSILGRLFKHIATQATWGSLFKHVATQSDVSGMSTTSIPLARRRILGNIAKAFVHVTLASRIKPFWFYFVEA